MNNKDITINLVTKADNSGAEEAKQAIDEVNTSAQNTGQVTQAASKTSIKSIREIGACVQWLGSIWAKVAITMSATFGAVGLITQAVNLLKTAWEWFNKDAIEAEKKKQELIAKTTKYLAKQAEETKKEREAKGNAKASELILDPIKKEIELLQKRNTEIQTGIELRFREIEHMASLANDDIQIERIKLARQKEAGEITESQWLKKDQDLRGKAEDNNDKKERAVHQTKIDAKTTEKDGIATSLAQILFERGHMDNKDILIPEKFKEINDKLDSFKGVFTKDDKGNIFQKTLGASDIALKNIAKAMEDIDKLSKGKLSPLFDKNGNMPEDLKIDTVKKEIAIREDIIKKETERLEKINKETTGLNNLLQASKEALENKGFVGEKAPEEFEKSVKAADKSIKEFAEALENVTTEMDVLEIEKRQITERQEKKQELRKEEGKSETQTLAITQKAKEETSAEGIESARQKLDDELTKGRAEVTKGNLNLRNAIEGLANTLIADTTGKEAGPQAKSIADYLKKLTSVKSKGGLRITDDEEMAVRSQLDRVNKSKENPEGKADIAKFLRDILDQVTEQRKKEAATAKALSDTQKALDKVIASSNKPVEGLIKGAKKSTKGTPEEATANKVTGRVRKYMQHDSEGRGAIDKTEQGQLRKMLALLNKKPEDNGEMIKFLQEVLAHLANQQQAIETTNKQLQAASAQLSTMQSQIKHSR